MASYWKSLPKKYCEVCKCWLGDNKATIEFHERGKSHQEKKRKQLEQIKRHGAQLAKDNAKADIYLKQMEKAAKKKFLQDLNEQGIKVTEDEFQKREQSTKAAIFKPSDTITAPNQTISKKPVMNVQPASKLQKTKTENDSVSGSSASIQDSSKTSASQPYGKWTVVENTSETNQTYTAAKTEQTALQFTEKRVSTGSLDKNDAEPVSFKKRKINNRSIRSKINKD